MAHYAWLDENNIVVNVTVGVDENIIQTDLDGTQVGGTSEAWETFYSQATGYNIKRTSYNGKIRKQYAGVGYFYDDVNDVFITPQPYPSWSLDNNFDWQPPIQRPDGIGWVWDESTLSWIELEA